MELITAIVLDIFCSALGLLVNMFYIFCLISPSKSTTKIRQPLLTLLVLMIFCTGLFQVSQILYLCLRVSGIFPDLKFGINMFMYYAMRVSMPTTLWLNIFYCTQIVPGRNAFYEWFKKNIRIIVYLSVVFTKIYFLFSFFLEFFLFYGETDDVAGNSTTESSKDLTGGAKEPLEKVLNCLTILTTVLICLGLIIMLIVNSTTVCYLYRHIKKMTKSGKSMNSQVLQNQVRVTITGLIQGPLYVFCSVGLFMDLYCIYFNTTCEVGAIWAIFTVYSLSTTLNLGVGQSLFRQRIIQLWRNGETSESDQTE